MSIRLNVESPSATLIALDTRLLERVINALKPRPLFWSDRDEEIHDKELVKLREELERARAE